jgi:adenylosuccinate synthase
MVSMKTVAVIGLLWGDEGKGKVVDLLSEKAEIVVRYQGGTNAGHTVYYKGKPIPLHLIPSGIFNRTTVCVIGNGCVIDLRSLRDEIALLSKEGIEVKKRLLISSRAHVTLPFHILQDKRTEEIRGSRKLGTTSKGIGPTYADKYSRTGIRIVDLLYPEELESLIEENLRMKPTIADEFDTREISEEYSEIIRSLKECIVESVVFLNEEIDRGKRVLFEGAQGSLLDVDLGTYPFVTSSNPTVGGISTGTGVSMSKIQKVIGVTKAYATRVGAGPFPTVFEEGFEEEFRKRSKEYGATTGRPRGCGWFDAVGVGYACMVNGIERIAITKLDSLSGFEKLRVCTEYSSKEGTKIVSYPPRSKDLFEVIPRYVEFEGWEKDIQGIQNEAELPSQALAYIKALEDILKVKVVLVSTGPKREDTIVREKIW